MDPASAHAPSSIEDDEWDADGFVIPSLGLGQKDLSEPDEPTANDSKPSSPKINKEEKIYLGPHGAPPSLTKQQELSASGRKQRLKHKLKDADKKFSGVGRENKVEQIREIVGGGNKVSAVMSKTSPRDWLDPHCHESQFERSSH
ncbi:uncharacterized protein LOC18438878 isoform X1 [Amborella trichopoda]|uniref:Uncharacterized protein n=1 Tax=Amborella trichopoda TaxID=13333 RepID=W1PKL4_AMBTC|nr:uncharacterized protein LOC18438878 isoform X1 [Amborella trichopoda]ERN10552.1 hypothetical protein AMTR_s00028p00023590 [Amborella trichopoda]|eukprot:XP_006848971.1 uncharacterized protein LOC18438878 isoform X1 [Amborella trichopoda]